MAHEKIERNIQIYLDKRGMTYKQLEEKYKISTTMLERIIRRYRKKFVEDMYERL